jgi:general secretion pathway protein N
VAIGRIVVFGVAAVVGVACGTIPFIPASYLAAQLDQASGGSFRLAEATGTVWNGRGRPVFTSGGETEVARITAFPALVRWDLAEVGIAPMRAVLRISGPGVVDKPFALTMTTDGIRLDPGAVKVPAEILEGAGSPLNTLKLGGLTSVAWDTLAWRSGQVEGNMTLDWTQARSALSRVEPLGNYRFTAKGTGSQVGFALATLSGPLLLSGNGTWQSNRGVQFRGEARAEQSRLAELAPLLGLLGRFRGPGVVELSIGS